jgi:hypothetical protein
MKIDSQNPAKCDTRETSRALATPKSNDMNSILVARIVFAASLR